MSKGFFRALLTVVMIVATVALFAAELTILTPLGRTDYQTNERIEFAVVRTNAGDLSADNMTVALSGQGLSQMSFSFPVAAVRAGNEEAAKTEILYINGYMLRPDTYTLTVTANGATSSLDFVVYSHIRQSTFKTIKWGGIRGDQPNDVTELEGFGFNVLLANPGVGTSDMTISAGFDILGNCLMGGGHQHDLKLTNDWSDPNVYIGAIQRGTDRTFIFRTLPNAVGAHMHDEPGLTWWHEPSEGDAWQYYDRTNPLSPHYIKHQQDTYFRAFNEELPGWKTLDTNNQEDLDTVIKISEFKLGYMDALWKASEDAIGRMKPNFLTVTQSQYGWTAIFDGYYFNVVRSMPIVSGHGGYSDFGPRDFNGTMFLEFALPRQLDKPTWYLPTWYSYETPEQYKKEQYLSFITGIQGLATPPGTNARSRPAEGVKESNLVMQKYGTIFEIPAYTKQDVAILYSKSDSFYKKTHTQFWDSVIQYMATKMIQFPINAVLEEDIIDGTVANGHKAVLISGVNYLSPAAVKGLEDFIADGGIVLQAPNSKVAIKGATMMSVDPTAVILADHARIQAMPNGDEKTTANKIASSFKRIMEYSKPYADEVKAELEKAGIVPPVKSSVNTMAVGHQTRGDIDYVMVVNFTPIDSYDGMLQDNGNPIGIGGAVDATTNLTFTNVNNRAIYEAREGVQIVAAGQSGAEYTLNNVNFGAGDMKIYVLTARPIGGVQVGTATVSSDFTRAENPIRLKFAVSLADNDGRVISGTAPLQIVVTDNFGVERFNIYRSTEDGVCSIELPMAANDANGTWTITATELISNKASSNTFEYKTAKNIGATAGLAPRAAFYKDDEINIYKFFRTAKDVTVVYGSDDYCMTAALRISEIFAPYNVNVKIMSAEEANHARPLTNEELLTWSGNQANGFMDKDTGELVDDNSMYNPKVVGYDVPGSIVVIGNAANNPLIAFLTEREVLPYKVNAQFPGVGNGMIAWNIMTLGHDVEAIAAIANDEKGLNEAIGNMFTIGIGMDPLNPWVMPESNSITPVQTAN